jgi:hypothetical protein
VTLRLIVLGFHGWKTMMCWWEARGGDDGASLSKTYWRSKCKRSMTKFKAGGKTLGEPVGDVAKTKPSRMEGSVRQQSNIELDHGKTRESSETCWDDEAKQVPGHWSTKKDACGDNLCELMLMGWGKTGAPGVDESGDSIGACEIRVRYVGKW